MTVVAKNSSIANMPPIAAQIWDMKYRFKDADGLPIDQTQSDTWRRIAKSLAAVEQEPAYWEDAFMDALTDYRYLPAGRITAGAGTARQVTLFNCFVMGTVPDSMSGIFDMLKEAALTMQQGGGIGYDFSTIRPKGAEVKGVAADASGPLSFMDVWDAMCRTIMSAGSRRGAMMATMRCDHPDVFDFITAKHDAARLRMFNMSVLITDPFMDAVKADADWDLVFKGEVYKTVKARDLWDAIMKSTYEVAEPGVIFIDRINTANNLNYCETIAATNPCFTGDQEILTSDGPKSFSDLDGTRVSVLTETDGGEVVYRDMDVFKTAEDQEIVRVTLSDGTEIDCTPTHEFFDITRKRIAASDLTPGMVLATCHGVHLMVMGVTPLVAREDVYCGTVDETHRFFLSCKTGAVLVKNCGEQPLPPYGACLLGSINMARLVSDPFGDNPCLDEDELVKLVSTAVRMMDNVVDASQFPLEAQREEAQAKRRIGLGVTGLADALLMVGLRYGSEEAAAKTDAWMHAIARAAYLASVELAKEKGAFPLFDAEKFLASGNMMNMDEDVREAIRTHGIRNALLTSIAPTGTISLYAGNVSSGIEPVFAYAYTRKVLQKDGSRTEEEVVDYAVQMWRDLKGDAALPDYFVNAQTLAPMDHVRMQAAAQRWIDSSISKTINCPEDISFEDFKDVYMAAWDQGCKGCTTYRPNAVTGSVLSVAPEKPADAPVAPAADPITTDALIARPEALTGATYKMKFGDHEHAYYITVNDMVKADGSLRPFEIFINTKNIEGQAWVHALTLMISAVFRRTDDVAFVADELRGVMDPRGGAWIGGRFVPSVPAMIGNVLAKHFNKTVGTPPAVEMPDVEITEMPNVAAMPKQRPGCKYIGDCNIQMIEGCEKCTNCDYAKCG